MILFITCIKIFFARLVDVCLGTFRTVNVVKGNRFAASVIAFFEVYIWYLVAKEALNPDIVSWLIPVSYSGGFAAGTYLGTLLSARLISGHLTLNVISTKITLENVNIIKDKGFGVSILNTLDGKTMLLLEIDKKYLKELKLLIKSFDPDAFIIANETKYVYNGFIK